MWFVGLFNSVYVQRNLYYNCKFTKFDTKLNVQIPVKSVHRNRNSGRSMIGNIWHMKTRKLHKNTKFIKSEQNIIGCFLA